MLALAADEEERLYVPVSRWAGNVRWWVRCECEAYHSRLRGALLALEEDGVAHAALGALFFGVGELDGHT